jgi:hypothetical protein
VRQLKSTNSGNTENVKSKRIFAPRIISDHIMVQEDFERLHKKSPTICESWSRRNGRSWCISCRRRCRSPVDLLLLGADKDCADNCSPNCC